MESTTEGVRERTRRAMQREIAAVGVQLFVRQGYEQTTVDQIAAAARISRRSFFRYFPTKEDVLLGELLARGRLLAEVIAGRPPQERPWDAMRAALLTIRDSLPPVDQELEIERLLYDVPALHARHLEKQLAWRALLEPEVARRIAEQDDIDPATARRRAAALVASALSCLDTATAAWVDSGATLDLEQLYDEAVAAVRGG